MISVLEKSPTLHWLGRQLFNRDDPAAFFDPLLERINPMWVRQYTPARVKAIYNETADTKTFVLAPAGRWKGFAAGQHVNIGIDVDGNGKLNRMGAKHVFNDYSDPSEIIRAIRSFSD